MEDKKKRAIKNLSKLGASNGKSSAEIAKGMHTAFPNKKQGTSDGHMQISKLGPAKARGESYNKFKNR